MLPENLLFAEFIIIYYYAHSGQSNCDDVPWLAVSDIAPRGPSPGMLDINDLMGGGQAIGGVVGDGLSAGTSNHKCQ